jgi:hypothetical protein
MERMNQIKKHVFGVICSHTCLRNSFAKNGFTSSGRGADRRLYKTPDAAFSPQLYNETLDYLSSRKKRRINEVEEEVVSLSSPEVQVVTLVAETDVVENDDSEYEEINPLKLIFPISPQIRLKRI